MKLIIVIFLVICTFQIVVSQGAGESRIIDGKPLRPNELPFMISIQAFGIPFCGGSLITESYVLTAAVCGGIFPGVLKTAVAGTNVVNMYAPRPPATQQSRPIITFTSHPNYANDNGPNNIAMAKTVFPFVLNKNVSPIQLPPVGLTDTPILTKAFIAGWGSTTTTPGTYSMNLLKAVVPVNSRTTCEAAWPHTIFTPTDICAGVLGGTPSACFGDLGGPLALDYGLGQYALVGVLRYGGLPCGHAGQPVIFVDVSNAPISDFVLNVIHPPAPPAP